MFERGVIPTAVMLAKMTAVTALYIGLTYFLWKKKRGRQIDRHERLKIGLIYGAMAILSTHFGVNYNAMMLNVRDLAPLCAGLFFDPWSGIIAGLIGGIERYIAGTYWGVGSFTRVACSISTILAGFLSAFLNRVVFNGKKPSGLYAFFMGAVIEVFHMYVVFLTHRSNVTAAFAVVKICALPMIGFSAVGLAATAIVIRRESGEWTNPLKRRPLSEVPVSFRFQEGLFAVIGIVFLLNYSVSFTMQTHIAEQEAREDIENAAADIETIYDMYIERGVEVRQIERRIGKEGIYYLYEPSGNIIMSEDYGDRFLQYVKKTIGSEREDKYFRTDIDDESFYAKIFMFKNGTKLLIMMPESVVYEVRDIQGYETLFADILLFTVIYVVIALLVQAIVVDNLELVNKSLDKITNGELNEAVNVYSSSEFASLSDDINQTVNVLKGYIAAAEKRIEQELLLAHTIQDSALPKNFTFDHGGFELYATMDPAKEVGGDFYDFFFVDTDKLALVIADVAGKGIPAALFMMRSKTALRSLAEIGTPLHEVLERVNNELCKGNEADMFVTVWMGVVDLRTGNIRCVNAGHEYPAVIYADGSCEFIKDEHRLPLGAMENMKYVEYDMHIDPGDCLYVYTDGVPEAINTREEQYGGARTLRTLSRHPHASMKDLLKFVKMDMDRFVGEADQFDDITMLGFRFFGMKPRDDKE